MPKIDLSIVTAITSSATAIIAIVAPTVSTILTIRSQERMKKEELYSPRIYDVLSEMSEAYSALHQRHYGDEISDEFYAQAAEKFNHFSAACYKVMALIPDEDINVKISNLLTDRQTVHPTSRHDAQFIEIMADINSRLHKSKLSAWLRKKSNTA